MSREQKIKRAQKLRERGLTYKEVGSELGVSPSSAFDYVTGKVSEAKRRWVREHPERVRAQNIARNAAKREWEAGECSKCGGRVADIKRAGRCEKCHHAEERAAAIQRCERLIELRKRGLLNYQIAERENVSTAVVANLLCRASRRYGLTVPPSPYYKASVAA